MGKNQNHDTTPEVPEEDPSQELTDDSAVEPSDEESDQETDSAPAAKPQSSSGSRKFKIKTKSHPGLQISDLGIKFERIRDPETDDVTHGEAVVTEKQWNAIKNSELVKTYGITKA